jgi:hypothetical protein
VKGRNLQRLEIPSGQSTVLGLAMMLMTPVGGRAFQQAESKEKQAPW